MIMKIHSDIQFTENGSNVLNFIKGMLFPFRFFNVFHDVIRKRFLAMGDNLYILLHLCLTYHDEW